MKLLLATVGALCAMPFVSAMAQTFEFTMFASKSNMVACATQDMSWGRPWNLIISGNSAIMSTAGSNSITLKKSQEGIYETTAFIGGDSVTFTAVTRTGGRSMKVVGKNLGCRWEGSLEPFTP